MYTRGIYEDGVEYEFCGSTITDLSQSSGPFNQDTIRAECCAAEGVTSAGDCDTPNTPRGPAVGSVFKFAASESDWLDAFLNAWFTATTNGHSIRKNTLISTSLLGKIWDRILLFWMFARLLIQSGIFRFRLE